VEGLNLARGQNVQFIWVENGKDNKNTRKGQNSKSARVSMFWVLSNQEEIHFGGKCEKSTVLAFWESIKLVVKGRQC
jgi:hypothetical protein